MNKTVEKVIFIFAILVLLVPFSNSLAAPDATYADIDTSGYGPSDSELKDEFDNIGKVILGAVQGIGIGLSVIVLAIIGIKYMLGSVEEKAEYKETMLLYLIGVFFLASVTTIPNIIYEILN